MPGENKNPAGEAGATGAAGAATLKRIPDKKKVESKIKIVHIVNEGLSFSFRGRDFLELN